jgi:ABC-type polysaccharide/polyol phosphate transport system ATPase subunit
MSLPNAIEVERLGKTYRIYGSPHDRWLERMPWNKRTRHRAISALQDISFTVKRGECVGLIGGNGAGKSTLLKILTGTTFPSEGRYRLVGRVASLLELGAGFHQDFTGRENIYMNAAMMGFSRAETRRKFDEILDFSELHDFVDAPLRTYSSGMVCRLGFSVAVATDPDVLIIDEILAVGDMHFQRKCVDRIWDYKNRGKTLFFCSHSLYDVRQICDQAIWLKHGRMQLMADAVTVTNEYATYENQLIAKQEAAQAGTPVKESSEDLPHIVSARVIDPRTGQDRHTFSPNEAVGVRVHVKNGRVPVPLAVAVGYTRSDGTLVFAHTTQLDGKRVEFQEGHVTVVMPNVKLLSGEFVVPVWLLDQHGVHRFHERPAEKNLIVQNRTKDLGLFLQDHEWIIEPLVPAAAERRP